MWETLILLGFPIFLLSNILNTLEHVVDFTVDSLFISIGTGFNERLTGIEPFKIELQGFSKCEDIFGNYLFLNVIKGQNEIIKIHNLLYDNEFHKFDASSAYLPHMTVGKFKDSFELEQAYEEIKDMDCLFASYVDKISVEMIGDNEEYMVVIEKQLKISPH
ncbi:MAG: 2'-5' RNA ligase family protein [Lachnospiraceae bacterium]|nr:2'-5' RNA ligase family protein [Lachnospiraceae bacterium]